MIDSHVAVTSPGSYQPMVDLGPSLLLVTFPPLGSKPGGINLYLFLVAAKTKDHKLGVLEQQKFILS